MAFIGVKVAQKRKVGSPPFGGGNVGDQQVHHAAPLGLGRPGGVAQGDVGHGADPVAVMKVVVVHLLDAEILFRVSQHGTQPLVEGEIGLAVVTRKPGFNAGFEQL